MFIKFYAKIVHPTWDRRLKIRIAEHRNNVN